MKFRGKLGVTATTTAADEDAIKELVMNNTSSILLNTQFPFDLRRRLGGLPLLFVVVVVVAVWSYPNETIYSAISNSCLYDLGGSKC